MAAVQLMKTSILEYLIGYFAHLHPRPMLLAQADKRELVKLCREKLDPMIQSTPELRRIMGRAGKRDPDQTLATRKFPGGALRLGEASTAAQTFSMIPAAVVLLDELDKWRMPASSDPVEMAKRRMTIYQETGQDLVVSVCSPELRGESLI